MAILLVSYIHVGPGCNACVCWFCDGLIDDRSVCRWGARQDDADWGDRGGRCVRDREDLEDVPVHGRHRLRLLLLQRPHRNPGKLQLRNNCSSESFKKRTAHLKMSVPWCDHARDLLAVACRKGQILDACKRLKECG